MKLEGDLYLAYSSVDTYEKQTSAAKPYQSHTVTTYNRARLSTKTPPNHWQQEKQHKSWCSVLIKAEKQHQKTRPSRVPSYTADHFPRSNWYSSRLRARWRRSVCPLCLWAPRPRRPRRRLCRKPASDPPPAPTPSSTGATWTWPVAEWQHREKVTSGRWITSAWRCNWRCVLFCPLQYNGPLSGNCNCHSALPAKCHSSYLNKLCIDFLGKCRMAL